MDNSNERGNAAQERHVGSWGALWQAQIAKDQASKHGQEGT